MNYEELVSYVNNLTHCPFCSYLFTKRGNILDHDANGCYFKGMSFYIENAHVSIFIHPNRNYSSYYQIVISTENAILYYNSKKLFEISLILTDLFPDPTKFFHQIELLKFYA